MCFKSEVKTLKVARCNRYCEPCCYLDADSVFPVNFVTTTRGALLVLLDGLLYRQQCKATKDGYKTLYCVMYGRFQCPAVLTLNAFNSIVCVRGNHNHPNPVIFDTPREALIIPSRNKRGQGMLVFRNYTYSWRNHKKNGSYWTCSSHHKKGCKANITTDESKVPFRITKFHTKHNHPPPAIKLPTDIEYI